MGSHDVARILDANFNRSREALRVMEEYARFVLDDAALTEALKTARHDLTATIRDLSDLERKGGHGPPLMQDAASVGPSSAPEEPGKVATGEATAQPGRNPRDAHPKNDPAPGGAEELDLALHRDVVGDVGTQLTTPAESKRSSEVEVVLAACKRLTESLRCLEEYGKIGNPRFAAQIEQLRYRSYDLERRLLTAARAREKFAHVRLYVLITESLCRGNWFETARAALEGGADCLQLREKELPDQEVLDRARRLADLCRERNRLLIVNDRPDIALASGAHGVHLGQDDLPVAAARRILPARMIVGISTHSLEQVEAAAAQAPDYIAVGPMFDSPVKPQPHIAGPALLAAARTRTALSLVAIGGIDDRNVDSVLAAAPACICVCRAIVGRADARRAAQALRRKLELHFSSEKIPNR